MWRLSMKKSTLHIRLNGRVTFDGRKGPSAVFFFYYYYFCFVFFFFAKNEEEKNRFVDWLVELVIYKKKNPNFFFFC